MVNETNPPTPEPRALRSRPGRQVDRRASNIPSFENQPIDVSDGNTWDELITQLNEQDITNGFAELKQHYTKQGVEEGTASTEAAKSQVLRLVDRSNHLSKSLQTFQEELQRSYERIQQLTDGVTNWKGLYAEQIASQKETQRLQTTNVTLPRPQKIAPDANSLPRGVEIRDPLQLTDGKDPQIDDWLLDVRGKLEGDSDLFPNERRKITWLTPFIQGHARTFIKARLLPSAARPFQSAEEVLQVLEKSMAKSATAKKQEARAEFKTLYQDKKNFPEFWAEFLRLATELEKDEREQLDELYDRVRPSLQRQAIGRSFDSPYELADFFTEVEPRIRGVEAREAREAREERFSQTKGVLPALRDKPRPAPEPRAARRAIRTPPPLIKEQKPENKLRNELACYRCGGKGHFSKDCSSGVNYLGGQKLYDLENDPAEELDAEEEETRSDRESETSSDSEKEQL